MTTRLEFARLGPPRSVAARSRHPPRGSAFPIGLLERCGERIERAIQVRPTLHGSKGAAFGSPVHGCGRRVHGRTPSAQRGPPCDGTRAVARSQTAALRTNRSSSTAIQSRSVVHTRRRSYRLGQSVKTHPYRRPHSASPQCAAASLSRGAQPSETRRCPTSRAAGRRDRCRRTHSRHAELAVRWSREQPVMPRSPRSRRTSIWSMCT